MNYICKIIFKIQLNENKSGYFNSTSLHLKKIIYFFVMNLSTLILKLNKRGVCPPSSLPTLKRTIINASS